MKRAARFAYRVALDIFDGFRNAPGVARLDRWDRRRDAIANLQLARELQKHPALVDSARMLEESALKTLRETEPKH